MDYLQISRFDKDMDFDPFMEEENRSTKTIFLPSFLLI